MSEIGTLQELNVNPGDVVENQKSFRTYTITDDMECGGIHVSICIDQYRLISRAADTPKLWRDMTHEENGALLLAMYERKTVQVYSAGTWEEKKSPPFYDGWAYRVKPEPKVETVTLYGRHDVQWVLARCQYDTHKITFNTINGKPDCASIKMEPLA